MFRSLQSDDDDDDGSVLFRTHPRGSASAPPAGPFQGFVANGSDDSWEDDPAYPDAPVQRKKVPHRVFVSGKFAKVYCLDPASLVVLSELETGSTNLRVAELGDGRLVVSGRVGVQILDPFGLSPDLGEATLDVPSMTDVWGLDILPGRMTESGYSSHIVAGGKRKIVVLDSLDGQKIVEFPDAPDKVLCLRAVPQWNGEVYAAGVGSGSTGKHIRCYDVAKGRLRCLFPENEAVYGIEADVNYGVTYVASSDTMFDKSIKMWSRDTVTCVCRIPLDRCAYSLHYSRDMTLLLAGIVGGEIVTFDPRMPSQIWSRFKPHRFCRPYSIARVDADVFVSCCDDKTVATWEPSGRIVSSTTLSGWAYGVTVVGGDRRVGSSFSAQEEDERLQFLLACPYYGDSGWEIVQIWSRTLGGFWRFWML